MKTIRAIYEEGVFKPVNPVNLPEHCQVEFEPKVSLPDHPQDLSKCWGTLRDWPEDPVAFQRRVRGEWE